MRILLATFAVALACASAASTASATTPSPSPTPSPAPSPSASPTPTLLTVPILPPEAVPEIVAVVMPSSVVSGGETVSGVVIASSNVASVEVKVGPYVWPTQKVAPGEFTVSLVVPRVPRFLRQRSYTLEVLAHNTRGDTVTYSMPLTLR